MKIKAISFLVVFMLLFLASCAAQNDAAPQNDPNPPTGQAGAYFAVFESLYEYDPALNHDSAYLSLDLTNVIMTDTESLIALMQDFCDNNGYTLLLDTIDGLMEKGYVKDLYFEDGFVIIFDDIKSNENTLVTSATKWRSGLGAVGAEYTVEKNENSWEITKTGNHWIS